MNPQNLVPRFSWERIAKILVVILALYVAVTFGIIVFKSTRKQLQFHNATNEEIAISYTGTDGRNSVSMNTDVPIREYLNLPRLTDERATTRYEITIAHVQKGKKPLKTTFTWTGEPKGIMLEYSDDNTVRWLKDE
jgi:hypothetical protein